MRTPVLKNLAVLLSCCGAWHAASAADASRGQQPMNLARPSAGAQLSVDGAKADSANASALLRDDDPLGYPLAAGDTSLTLTLPQIEVVKKFNFLNLTAAGKVSVLVSNSKGADGVWREVDSKTFSGTDVVSCEFGSVEARQVKLTFHLDTAGRVDTFGLYGLRTVANASGARVAAGSSADKALMYNYAGSSADSGVVMVSPGEDLKAAQNLSDGDVGSTFTFKATDPEPMAVVDLGGTRTLNRVSVSFKAGPGMMNVYLLPDPKEKSALDKKSKAGTIQDVIAEGFPGTNEPVLRAETGKQPGLNRLSGNVSGQTGRYLVLDFHPAGGAVAANGKAADFKDFKDVDFKDTGAQPQQATGAPLEVSELTAFGNTPPGSVVSNFPPNFPGVSVNVPPNVPPGGTGTNPNPPIFPPSGGSSTVSP